MSSKAPPPSVVASSRTLWMGDVDTWMDQTYLTNVFNNMGLGQAIKSIKVPRDRSTGTPAGYGFIELTNRQTAENVLKNYNGTQIPGTNRHFKFGWGMYGSGPKPPALSSVKPIQKVSVFVGDLDASVNDKQLLEFFQEKYPSAYFARIIYDPVTKHSKSYGFVEFNNNDEAQKAITEVNGMFLAGRMIRVSNAYSKNTDQQQQPAAFSGSDILPVEDQQAQYLALVQKQQLYQYYYSMTTDPLQKIQYQKRLDQLACLDVLRSSKRKSLKSELENIKSLESAETRVSEPFLEELPTMVTYKGKLAARMRIFH